MSGPRSIANGNLLFPYATSAFGFDTEITIANTSQDTLGTTPANGTCVLRFIANGAVAATQTTRTIAAGQQIAFKLSQGGGGVAARTNFTGYVTASCSFPLARGAADIFVSGKLAFSQAAQNIATPRVTTAPTNLLLTYVTNQAGFDTGIAIANTSLDPFGTTQGSGACTLNFLGSPAHASVSTGTLAPGTLYANVLSALAPGFQGYIVASCNFRGATGVAFVSDQGVRNVAYSETPEVLTVPRTATTAPLLFPAVTSRSGQDTGIAIANTTRDPFGTTQTPGTCTLNFYGTNAPASPATTPTISAGTVYATLLSTLAPGFSGYVTVTCGFPLARGWAFTTAAGATVDGYEQTPEVVSTPRSTTPVSLLFTGVSNWNGPDTGITISNTSQDSFGTAQASGRCTIHYFGLMANGGSVPAAQTSSIIGPGQQLSFTISQGNPAQGIAGAAGFRGYVIADCGFPLARGIAVNTGTPSGDTVNITVNTVPTGRTFSIDGVTYGSPQTVSLLAGVSHTYSAVSPQLLGLVRYPFANWDFGSGPSSTLTQNVVAPFTNTTYTGAFTTQYVLSTSAYPALGGTITAGGWFDAGSVVQVTATPNGPGFFNFAYFSGDLTGPTNPQNLTMNGPRNVVANFSGATPSFSVIVGSHTGTAANRQWPIGISNAGTGTATNTQITQLSLSQTGGTACSPAAVITSPATPVSLGSIAFQQSATLPVNLDFHGCPPGARFSLTFTYSANSGSYKGTVTFNNMFY